MSYCSQGLEYRFDFNPYSASGVVYGVLLNQRSALAALGEQVKLPPYAAAPKAPILYVKPRNTLSLSGGSVTAPSKRGEFEVGATLGVLIGRAACNVNEADAIDFVAGYLAVADLSVPHASFYRPSIRYKAHDGSCVLGMVTTRAALANPNDLDIRIRIDSRPAHASSTRDLIRPVARLLQDVTEFMTLWPGDVLCVGVAAQAPRIRAGQSLSVEISGLTALTAHVVEGES